MPAVMEAIDHMTTSEKLETIDYLVSSISAALARIFPTNGAAKSRGGMKRSCAATLTLCRSTNLCERRSPASLS